MLGLPSKKLKLAWLVSFLMFTGPCGCESHQPGSSLLTEGHKPEGNPGPSSSLTLGTSFTALCLLSVLTQECVLGRTYPWAVCCGALCCSGHFKRLGIFHCCRKNCGSGWCQKFWLFFVCLFNFLFILCGLHIMQLSPIPLPVP